MNIYKAPKSLISWNILSSYKKLESTDSRNNAIIIIDYLD